MLKFLITILFVFVTAKIIAQETNYQRNLKLATDLFISKSELPDSVLLQLVPDSYGEFELLYGTTHPNNEMQHTGFFYSVTQQIFDKFIIEKKEKFYYSSIQLASFADGEFGEAFIDKLEIIIKLDKEKFCESIKGKWFTDHNPIKYFSEQNQCE